MDKLVKLVDVVSVIKGPTPSSILYTWWLYATQVKDLVGLIAVLDLQVSLINNVHTLVIKKNHIYIVFFFSIPVIHMLMW